MQVGHAANLFRGGGEKVGGAGSSLGAITLFEPGYRDAMDDRQEVMVTIYTPFVG